MIRLCEGESDPCISNSSMTLRVLHLGWPRPPGLDIRYNVEWRDVVLMIESIHCRYRKVDRSKVVSTAEES
jgi:hypothetical protein